MPPRSSLSPKVGSYPQNDVATYRDLLLFEERLKSTASSLQKRKSRYQLFLFQLLLAIAFLLVEVLLPPDISLISIPCTLALRRVLPNIYTAETKVDVHPYFSTGLLFVSITTLALFFASGTYADKIAYANKYVPHANRALRSFNMYLNVRKPPLHSKFQFNPLSFLFARPASESTTSTSSSSSSSTSASPQSSSSHSSASTDRVPIPIPTIPPTNNPRGELRFSSRVDRAFRDGYERYRANFERRRAVQEQADREKNRWLPWPWRRSVQTPSLSASRPGDSAGTASPVRQRDSSNVGSLRRQRTPLHLTPSIAERRKTPPLGWDREAMFSASSGSVTSAGAM
ncbi:unnamed protein product [Mycena citricolor]|uniref:Transmembrane protein 188 n=1 Tax=Mycena citricolor TaxID=2018698 RepID=A0AAD2HH30_9AGAR|nr:unnamed protein product [Mycena citricolor]